MAYSSFAQLEKSVGNTSVKTSGSAPKGSFLALEKAIPQKTIEQIRTQSEEENRIRRQQQEKQARLEKAQQEADKYFQEAQKANSFIGLAKETGNIILSGAKEMGKETVKGIVRPFYSLAETPLTVATGGKKTFGTVNIPGIGPIESYANEAGRIAGDIVDNKAPLRSILNPIGTGILDTAGLGIGGAIVKQGVKQGLKTAAIQASKEGGIYGGLYGGVEAGSNANSFQDAGKNIVYGAALGAGAGAGLSSIGYILGKSFSNKLNKGSEIAPNPIEVKQTIDEIQGIVERPITPEEAQAVSEAFSNGATKQEIVDTVGLEQYKAKVETPQATAPIVDTIEQQVGRPLTIEEQKISVDGLKEGKTPEVIAQEIVAPKPSTIAQEPPKVQKSTITPKEDISFNIAKKMEGKEDSVVVGEYKKDVRNYRDTGIGFEGDKQPINASLLRLDEFSELPAVKKEVKESLETSIQKGEVKPNDDGTITVYRVGGVPKDNRLTSVTYSKDYAREFSKGTKSIEEFTINKDDIKVFIGKDESEVLVKSGVLKKEKPTAQSPLHAEAKKYATPEEFVKAHGIDGFHGTTAKFDTFDINKTGSATDDGMYGKGFYFADNLSEANRYSRGTGEVKQVKLDLRNPYIINSKKDIPKIDVPTNTIEEMKNSGRNYSKAFTDYLKSKGYDGVIDNIQPNNKQYVVFSPDQIKTKSQLQDIWKEAHSETPKTVKIEKPANITYEENQLNKNIKSKEKQLKDLESFAKEEAKIRQETSKIDFNDSQLNAQYGDFKKLVSRFKTDKGREAFLNGDVDTIKTKLEGKIDSDSIDRMFYSGKKSENEVLDDFVKAYKGENKQGIREMERIAVEDFKKTEDYKIATRELEQAKQDLLDFQNKKIEEVNEKLSTTKYEKGIKERPEGEGKVSQYAKDIERRALEKKLKVEFGNLAEYTPQKRAEQAKVAAELMIDRNKTLDVLYGDAELPTGLSPNALSLAIDNSMDTELINALKNSKIASDVSQGASNLSMSVGRNAESPVKTIRDIENAKIAKKKNAEAKAKEGAKLIIEKINKRKAVTLKKAEDMLEALICK